MHRREEDGIPDPGIMPTSSSIRIQAQPQPMMMSSSSIGGGSVPMTCCSANINKHQFSNVFLVGYLGSAILTKGKTGLGCLQQPLRELYYIYRQNGARLLQERRVFISMDGITMIYNEYGVEKFLHNDLSSVYDIQLLQLICEQRKDKKLHCAFLPIDHEPDICYTNLFHPVDKQSTRLIENTAHPAIIALIMRRSVGIQALECHVLITRVLNDSIRIVNEVRNVCARHKYDLNQRANLFQYRPAVITSTAAIAEQQRAAAAQLQQQQQQQNNKPPVYHKPSPFSRLQKRNSSRDGPYDAFGSQSSASRLAAGGAVTDSRSNLQAQQLNRNVPPSPSLFSKIKSNLIDKSKSSAGDNKKQEKIKEPKPAKSNSKSRQKLTSASAINFPSCGDGSNGALDGRDSHRLPSIRPSSALAAPLVNITFSSKPKSKNKQQQNGLKQQSMSSLSHNVEVDAQSIKSSGSSKKDKSTSSSSSSKLSLGKRLLLSARSSLKSNSSSMSGNDSVNKSKMMSNSTTSLNAAASASPSRSRGGGDVDFRSKSRASIVANENTNPIVDCNGCNGNGAYGGYGVIQDSNFILKSRSPARVVLNRGPSMSPCCQSRRPSQTNTTTTTISQQSPAAASVLRNPSQTPSITSSTSHLSRRGVCELHPHASPLLPTRSDYYETTECETEDDNDRTKTRVIRLENQYQKRNFKYPLMSDPKLLANHLAWNRSSRSAECLDESLTIDEAHRHQQQVNRPVAVSPVARAVSPGFALLQQQQQQQQQGPQKAIITTTTSNCMGAPCRSRSYTTNQQQQPQSTSQQVTATTTIDSAYSTQSSNEDSSDSKPAPCNSGGSSSNGCNHACCKRCADAAAAASGSNISVMERLRHEQEQDEANRMVKKSNSHKIVGGVKVFPTLPHEHRHAAESRRQRLDDIERNLSRIEKNSWEMRQRSSDSNGANEEVIDLTRQQQQQQQQRQQNDEQSTQNSQRIQFKSTTEIPIEISSRQREPNIRLKNSVDYVQSKASHVANSTNNNNSSYGRNSNNNNNNAADKLSNSNNKLNYIYYFDNDHFGGY